MIKSVNILGRKFAVQRQAGMIIDNSDGQELAGHIDYERMTITVCDYASEEIQEEILIHEIMHGILYRTGAHNNFTEDQIETICDLAPLLVQTMKGIK